MASSPVLAAEEAAPPPSEPSAATPSAPEGATAPVPPDASSVMAAPPPAPPSFRIEPSKDTSIRIGLLLQPQFQSVSSATLDKYSNNLYIRRTRILVGGTLLGIFEYFLDTDYPNLFLQSPTGVAGPAGTPDTYPKATPGMNIQDAFGTWRACNDMVKVDVGYMLPPGLHNAVQGATTLYAWDYFSNSFLNKGNLFGGSTSPVGRDVGVQLRGLLVDGHLEYRAGLFQGVRNAPTLTEQGSRNFFRFAARVQVNLLEAETGFFYQGTYLGKRKILSVGGTVDVQDSYKFFGGDAFVDFPIDPIGVVTAQLNVGHWDPGTLFPATVLPAKETAIMGEAGFIFSAAQVGPILRFERLSPSGGNNQTRYVAGAAYFPYGHNINLKAFYTRFHEVGAARDTNTFNLQWQLYFF
jgi:hypothetical protein